MGKIVAFIGAWAIAFLAFFQVGGALRGDGSADPAAAHSAHMEGCMRQMRDALPNEASATKACECMYSEFAEKGYSLTDAFGSDFDDMGRITRGCAMKHGAQLQ